LHCEAEPSQKEKGTMEIFVEFRDDEDGENFLAELKKRPTDKFEASDYDHLIKPLPRHKKGYFRKYLS
jgi:hypothetical protein